MDVSRYTEKLYACLADFYPWLDIGKAEGEWSSSTKLKCQVQALEQTALCWIWWAMTVHLFFVKDCKQEKKNSEHEDHIC